MLRLIRELQWKIKKPVQKCRDCALLHKDYKTALRHYFLGRPIGCHLNKDGKTIGSEDNIQNINKSNEYECECFVKKTRHVIFKTDVSPGPEGTWIIRDEDIEPWDTDYSKHTWFRYGIQVALDLFLNKPFIKTCENCSSKSIHLCNPCTKTENIICDKWELDIDRLADFRIYHNLCDECKTENCIDRREILKSMTPKQRCDNWIPSMYDKEDQ